MKSTQPKRRVRTVFLALLFITFFVILLNEINLLLDITNRTVAITNKYLGELEEHLGTLTDKHLLKLRTTAEYLNYSSIVRRFLMTGDDYTLRQEKKNLDDLLDKLTAQNDDIYSVLIYRADNRAMVYSPLTPSIDERMMWESYREQFEAQPSSGRFFLMHSQENRLSYPAYAVDVASTQRHSFSQNIGTIVVLMNKDSLHDIVSLPATNENSLLLIIDENNRLILSSDAMSYDQGTITDLLGRSDTHIINLSIDGWRLICRVHISDEQLAQYDSIRLGVIRQAVIIIVLLVLIFITIYSGTISPIAKIHRELETMNMRSMAAHILTQSRFVEIGAIVSAFNSLIDIQEQNTDKLLMAQQHLYEAELAKRSSDIFALENQVNPHFMRNTLQCINGIAIYYDVPVIGEIVDALSVIYEYSLHELSIVTLEKEINIVRQYLKIVDIRYTQKYTCNLHVDENVLMYHMPKMILQPLIENAVYHGLDVDIGYTIDVSAMLDGGSLRIIVRDDGRGIEPERLQELRATLSDPNRRSTATAERRVGLVNIYRRMLLYNDRATMQIDSKPGEGTTMTLVFPSVTG